MKPSPKELECIRASWELRKGFMKSQIDFSDMDDETKLFLRLTISRLKIDDSMKGQPEIIKKLCYIYRLDHEVPPVKSFYLLWQCILNRDIKDEFPFIDFFETEKLLCIYKCVKILYGDTMLLEEIHNLQKESHRLVREEYFKNHPQGWISMVEMTAILPRKIDEVYGPYIP